MSKKTTPDTDKEEKIRFSASGTHKNFKIRLEIRKKEVWDDWYTGKTRISWHWEEVWMCLSEPTSSCCGIYELGEFANPEKKYIDWIDDNWKDKVLPELKKVKAKLPYLQAYVPQNNEYTIARKIFTELGFKPTMAIKTNHGSYHNVRWECYGNAYKGDTIIQKVLNEKDISAAGS